jgi:hypothetical protein
VYCTTWLATCDAKRALAQLEQHAHLRRCSWPGRAASAAGCQTYTRTYITLLVPPKEPTSHFWCRPQNYITFLVQPQERTSHFWCHATKKARSPEKVYVARSSCVCFGLPDTQECTSQFWCHPTYVTLIMARKNLHQTWGRPTQTASPPEKV